jgi:hypothetical protein
MKKIALVIALGVALTGCSSFGSKGITPSADAVTPVKDQKLSTSFTDEGVKIHYTVSGKLDRIEVHGQAPAWKRNVEVLAEADAMDKLVKFIHGKNVSSERRTRIISRAIDNASDLTNNKFRTVDGTLETDSKSLEDDMRSTRNGEEIQKDNTARRKAQIVDETLVNTVTEIRSAGFLIGVRKISDAVKDDGKLYTAVYQWSEADVATATSIRATMRKAQN